MVFGFDKSGTYRGSEDVSLTSGRVIWASFTDSATQYQLSGAFQIVCTWTQATVLHIRKNTQKTTHLKLLICETFLNIHFMQYLCCVDSVISLNHFHTVCTVM